LVFSSSTEHIETFQKINDKEKQQKEASSSRREEKQEKQDYEKPLPGISPKKLGLKRDLSFSRINLTRQVDSILNFFLLSKPNNVGLIFNLLQLG
jgi:hypothetical protein